MRAPYAFTITEGLHTRIPTNGCTDVHLNLVDDAGMPINTPTTLSFTFDTTLTDGGTVGFSAPRLRVPCGGAVNFPPASLTFTAGTSTRIVGLENVSINPRLFRVSATAPTIRPATQVFLAAPTSLDSDLAVLPLFTVSSSGTTTFRQYAIIDDAMATWAGFLTRTTPSTHAIRMGNNLVAFNWQVVNALTGADVPTPAPALSNVDGMARLFSNRVMLFSGGNTVVRFQPMIIDPGGVQSGPLFTLNGSQSLTPFSNAGEVAVEYVRSFGGRTFGQAFVWYSNVGTSTTVVGRASYDLNPNVSETLTGLTETSSTSTYENQAAMALNNNRVLLVTGNTSAFVSGASVPSPTATFNPIGLSGVGPLQFAHVTNSSTHIAFIRGALTMGNTRRVAELMVVDAASDAGVPLPLDTVPVDLSLTSGTRAISDPNLARGCVVNDSIGATFFYSLRSPGDSTYQHYSRRYVFNAAVLQPQVLIDIPGAEDAVISCGGAVFHHVDMWRY